MLGISEYKGSMVINERQKFRQVFFGYILLTLSIMLSNGMNTPLGDYQKRKEKYLYVAVKG